MICLLAAQGALFASSAQAANNPAGDLDQCRNGTTATPAQCTGNGTGNTGWANGNAGSSNSHWREGDYIAYRVKLSNMVTGVDQSLHISWDTTQGTNVHAIDYIGSFNATEHNADPCSTVSGCSYPNPSASSSAPFFPGPGGAGNGVTLAIPTDPMVNANMLAGHTQQAGVIVCFGCVPGSISAGPYDTTGSFGASSSQGLTFTFRTSVTNPVFAWGGHIASQFDWGTGHSAVSISGSPYHTFLLAVDGQSGQQDRSLSAAAVAGPPTIATQVRNATDTANVTSISLGQSVKDRANFSGSQGTVTGTATFFVCGPGAHTSDGCPQTATTDSGARQQVGTAVTLSSGSALSAAFTPTSTGTYCFGVLYTNDGASFYANGYFDAAGPVASECFTVGKASPSLTTTTGAASKVGDTLTDSATLTGSSSGAGGTITFYLFAPGVTCSTAGTGAVYVSSGISVNGDGTYLSSAGTESGSNTATTSGTYHWVAVYSGDTNNNGTDSGCTTEPVTIGKNSPTLSTTTGAASKIGDTLTDSATLSGATSAAGGTISFYLFEPGVTCSTAGTGAVYSVTGVAVSGNGTYDSTDASGTASGSNTATEAGTYHWVAVYSGDTNNNGTDSGCTTEPVTIGKNSPTLSTNATPSSGVTGTTLTDSATLGSATSGAGGTISFYLFAPGVTCSTTGTGAVYSVTGVAVSGNGTYSSSDASGTASGSNTATTVGTYHWVAVYSGDTNNNGTDSGCTTEPVVISNPTPSQITPTQTTCSQFNAGTAGTLSEVDYSVKGNKINSVSPGVFFYWVKVQATAGTNTFTITQTITTGNFNTYFFFASGSNAYTSTCGTLRSSPKITQSGGTVTVQFTAPTAGTYIIGIKYSTSNVKGATAPNPTTVHYVFATTGQSGSTQSIDLKKK